VGQGPSIRGDLARLYIAHKRDLALDDWSDEQVVAEVNRITSALVACAMVAMQRDDRAWLERYHWASEAFERLCDDLPATHFNA
jgi:hypothetical protein